MHSQNIAHRDLKANNVLIKYEHHPKPDGSVAHVPVAAVTDLGLAQLGRTPLQQRRGGAGGGAGGPAPASEALAPPPSFVDACRYDVMFWAVMVAHSGFGALGEWSTPMPADVADRHAWERQQWRGNTNRPRLREELLPDGLAPLLRSCWDVAPAGRPSFAEVVTRLSEICTQLQNLP